MALLCSAGHMSGSGQSLTQVVCPRSLATPTTVHSGIHPQSELQREPSGFPFLR